MISTPKWPGKLQHRGRAPKESPTTDLGTKEKQKILKEIEIEWKGMIARHRDRRNPITPTGRRGWTKWSEEIEYFQNWFLDQEDIKTMIAWSFVWNINKFLPDYTVPHHTRLQISWPQPWDPQRSKFYVVSSFACWLLRCTPLRCRLMQLYFFLIASAVFYSLLRRERVAEGMTAPPPCDNISTVSDMEI